MKNAAPYMPLGVWFIGLCLFFILWDVLGFPEEGWRLTCGYMFWFMITGIAYLESQPKWLDYCERKGWL